MGSGVVRLEIGIHLDQNRTI